MNISKIVENLKGHEKGFPPVENWNPELCVGPEFIIDREGIIQKRYVGPRSEAIFYNDLKKYL